MTDRIPDPEVFLQNVTDKAMTKILREFEGLLGVQPSRRDQELMRAAIGVGASLAMTEFRDLIFRVHQEEHQ